MALPDDYIPDSGFDLRHAQKKLYESPLPNDDALGSEAPKRRNALDSHDCECEHRRLMAQYQTEMERQADNRQDMSVDADFYDAIQWTPEDMAVLKERGQMPLTYNVISTSVNWVIGTQKKGRVDFKVLPRKKDDGKAAERKTELLKYLSDVNRAAFHRSRAFEDAVKVGVGWLEDGLAEDFTADILQSRYESWRNILWDSASTNMDLSDAAYVFRAKLVDVDIAKAMFPLRGGIIERSAMDAGAALTDLSDDAMNSQEQALDVGSGENGMAGRQRVRMVEAWFKKPAAVAVLKGGTFNGEMHDKNDPRHEEEIATGVAVITHRIMPRMHVAIFVDKGMLWLSKSPYRHNKYPFTPIWGYRRSRDNQPYGLIRNLRDIQSDVNKRASKALAILSANKIILEEGSVDDIDAFAEEAGRPDAVLTYKKGYNPPDINAERGLAAGHVQLMQQSISMIQQASGVTDEMLGRTTNATSGIAIQARQEQGTLATVKFFDNLRLANQLQGEKQLSLIEQFYTDEKAFRITNSRGTPDYVTVNDGSPENDITQTKADFVISEADWNETMRRAQTNELMEVLVKLAPASPQLVMVMLDLLVESMDIPNRETIVERIRSVTGMHDPDAEELSQEEQARAQVQQAQQQLQFAMAQAELHGKQADAQKTAAETQKTLAETQKTGMEFMHEAAETIGTRVNTQSYAIQAAEALANQPGVSAVADTILHESGFVSESERQEAARQQAIAQAKQAEAQELMQTQTQEAPQDAALQPPTAQDVPEPGEDDGV